MDSIYRSQSIMAEVINNNEMIKFKELSKRQNISVKQVYDLFNNINDIDIYDYYTFFFSYNEEEISLENVDENLQPEVGIDIQFNESKNRRNLASFQSLSKYDEWELYKILRQFQDVLKDIIKKEEFNKLHYDYSEYYKIIEKAKINRNRKIINREEFEKIKKIYKIIANKKAVLIKTKNAISNNIIPVCIYFNGVTEKWILNYQHRKGNLHSVRIDNILEIEEINDLQDNNIKIKKDKNNTLVKLRVYHEKNALEKAIKQLYKKNTVIRTYDTYSEFEFESNDNNSLRRWIRKLSPSVIVISPIELREKVILDIEKWQEVYELRK